MLVSVSAFGTGVADHGRQKATTFCLRVSGS